jgi:hypothetical protein
MATTPGFARMKTKTAKRWQLRISTLVLPADILKYADAKFPDQCHSYNG